MTPKQKIDFIILYFSEENFYLLKTVLSTPSEPEDVTWNTEIVTEDPEDKTEIVTEDPEGKTEIVTEDPEGKTEIVTEDPEDETVHKTVRQVAISAFLQKKAAAKIEINVPKGLSEEAALLEYAKVQFAKTGSQESVGLLEIFYQHGLFQPGVLPDDAEIMVSAQHIETDLRIIIPDLVRLYMAGEQDNAAPVLKMLFEKNLMQPNSIIQLSYNTTLLHYAMLRGYINIIKLLLNWFVNVNVPNSQGKTAVQLTLLALKNDQLPEQRRANMLLGLKAVLACEQLNWSGSSESPPLLHFAVAEKLPQDAFEVLLSAKRCHLYLMYQGANAFTALLKPLVIPFIDAGYEETPLRTTQIDNNLPIIKLFLGHPQMTDDPLSNIYLEYLESGFLLTRERIDAYIDTTLRKYVSCAALLKARDLMLAMIELVSDTPVLSEKAKTALVEGLPEDFEYGKRIFQNRFANSSPRCWVSILRKVTSLRRHQKTQNAEITSLWILDWMELNAEKWSLIISDMGDRYLQAVVQESPFPSLSGGCAIVVRTSEPSRDELIRQLQVILAYRMRCYMGTAFNENMFYEDFLSMALPEIMFFLRYENKAHFHQHLTDILRRCISSFISNNGVLFESYFTPALYTTGCSFVVNKLAEELGADPEKDKEFYAQVVEIFTSEIEQRKTLAVSQDRGSLDLSSVVYEVNEKGLKPVWNLLNTGEKITTLSESDQKMLLRKSKDALTTLGSEEALEILCCFYREGLSIDEADAAPVAPQTANDIQLKTQSILPELVLQYMYASSENWAQALKLFKKLYDSKMMQLSYRFNVRTQPTLLHIALGVGYHDMIDFLVQNGVNPNCQNGDGLTAVQEILVKLSFGFQHSVQRNFRKNMIEGLKKILNYNALNWNGNFLGQEPILIFAIKQDCPLDLFEALLGSRYCNPMYRYQGHTPLMHLIFRMFGTDSASSADVTDDYEALPIIQLFLAHPNVDPQVAEEDNNGTFGGLPVSIMDRLNQYYYRSQLIAPVYKVVRIAIGIISLCSSETKIPDMSCDALKLVFLEENNEYQLNYCKRVFQNRFAVTEPQTLGIILQKVRTLKLPVIETWMQLDSSKWSLALVAVGKQYIMKHSSASNRGLHTDFARNLQFLSASETDLVALERQWKMALEYRLRWYIAAKSTFSKVVSMLPSYLGGDDMFYDVYLASLLPQVTAFLLTQKGEEGEAWLRESLNNCLDKPFAYENAVEKRSLREVLFDRKLGLALQKNLHDEFCPELVKYGVNLISSVRGDRQDEQEQDEVGSSSTSRIKLSPFDGIN